MTWRIWSPVGSTSSSNASFERSFSSDAASALDEKRNVALCMEWHDGQRWAELKRGLRHAH